MPPRSTPPLAVLVEPFVSLCLLRRRPQDLPASTLLLGIALGAYLISSVLVLTAQFDARDALLGAVLDTALLCGLTTAVLSAMRLRLRVVQTLTALAGSGTVLTMVALPFVAWVSAVIRAGDQPGIAALLVWVLIVWSVAVVGHILRHALSTTYLAGVLVAFAFYLVSINVVGSVFEGRL